MTLNVLAETCECETTEPLSHGTFVDVKLKGVANSLQHSSHKFYYSCGTLFFVKLNRLYFT